MAFNNKWTPELIDYFRRKLRTGLSLETIAQRISAKFGIKVTRNALIGKAHRIGASLQNRDVPRKPRGPSKNNPGYAKANRDSPPVSVPIIPLVEFMESVRRQRELMINIEDLRYDTCRYPHGEEAPYKYCGEMVVHGAYCEEHAAICYMRPKGGR